VSRLAVLGLYPRVSPGPKPGDIAFPILAERRFAPATMILSIRRAGTAGLPIFRKP